MNRKCRSGRGTTGAWGTGPSGAANAAAVPCPAPTLSATSAAVVTLGLVSRCSLLGDVYDGNPFGEGNLEAYRRRPFALPFADPSPFPDWSSFALALAITSIADTLGGNCRLTPTRFLPLPLPLPLALTRDLSAPAATQELIKLQTYKNDDRITVPNKGMAPDAATTCRS